MKMMTFLRLSLLLCLFLIASALSDELRLYKSKPSSPFCVECDPMIVHECVPVEENAAPFRKYECTSGIVRNKVILKNPRIELKQLVKELNVYAPNGHGKSKVLENKKRSDFLNDINKMVLITGGLALFCYEINIYDNEDTIATFATDGAVFYDKSNKLLYLSNGREDLLPKYWGILPENKCR